MNDAAVTPTFTRSEGRKKKDEIPEEERILRDARQKQQLISKERARLDYFRIRHEAAMRIQKAWKMYKFRAKGLMKNARESVRQKRLDAGELEWRRQIAACTIQLAWRKYFRRCLLQSLNVSHGVVGSGVRRRAMHMWDAAAIATKQRTVADQIYREHLYAPDWHPLPRAAERPTYMKEACSPAALAFNFAREQYYPPTWHDGYGYGGALANATGAAPARQRSPELTVDHIDSFEADVQRDMVFIARNYSKFSAVAYGQQDGSRRGSSY